MLVAPSAGTAHTVSVSSVGDSVAYTATTAGYDVFIYEVCDRLRNCHSAEVTIVVRAAPGGVR